MTSRRALHAVCAVLHKEIVTGAMNITSGVLKDPLVINHKDASGTIPVDKNTVRITPITNTHVLAGTGTSDSPISIGIHKIEGPRRSINPKEARKYNPLDASITRFPAKHRNPTPGWSNIKSRKVVTNESDDV